jgi:hypothetical protein
MISFSRRPAFQAGEFHSIPAMVRRLSLYLVVAPKYIPGNSFARVSIARPALFDF